MGSNPINLFVRFLLEVTVLLATGIWGWKLTNHGLKFVLGFGIPILLAVIWGLFAVPEDPSRSGAAPIVVSGWFRLLIELLIFSFGAWCIYNLGYSKISLVITLILVIHYAVSHDRVIWLLGQ